jgi:GNAT superfamily N-acetyltransferase
VYQIHQSKSVILFLKSYKSLKQNLGNIFVAVKDDQVIGLIGRYQDSGRWAGKSLGDLFPKGKDIYWVSYFAVSDSLRGQGLGTRLMQHLIGEVKKKQARELWVYTRRARGFYEKMGFTFITCRVIEDEAHDFLKYSF